MGFEVVIAISASDLQVWATLTDVEHWPEWTTSMTTVTRIDDGPFAVGSQARIKQPKLAAMIWTVTEFTPGYSFVWQATRPGLTLVAGHYLSSGSTGTVNLTLRIEQKGLVGRILEPLTEKSAERHVQLEAEGHKRRAEAPVEICSLRLFVIALFNRDRASVAVRGVLRTRLAPGPWRALVCATGGAPHDWYCYASLLIGSVKRVHVQLVTPLPRRPLDTDSNPRSNCK
jgi:hypothetical protein